jgi:hypothetical protein
MGKQKIQNCKMIRITKGNKVQKILIGTSEVSSVFIIPGVTNYTNVFTYGNMLCLSNNSQDESANIIFANESDLERFIMQFMKDMKGVNAPINVNVEQKAP